VLDARNDLSGPGGFIHSKRFSSTCSTSERLHGTKPAANRPITSRLTCHEVRKQSSQSLK
jgi:hypothetical protein